MAEVLAFEERRRAKAVSAAHESPKISPSAVRRHGAALDLALSRNNQVLHIACAIQKDRQTTVAEKYQELRFGPLKLNQV